MTVIDLTNAYLNANVLAIVAASLLFLLHAINRHLNTPFAHRNLLKIGYLLALCLALPFAKSFIPVNAELIPPAAEVWYGDTMNSTQKITADTQGVAITFLSFDSSISLRTTGQLAVTAFCLGILLWALRLFMEVMIVARMLKKSHTIRRSGRVRLLVMEKLSVPFSIWLPRSNVIAIPYALLESKEDLKLVISHEAEHHRQHHTFLIYFLRLLEGLFFWNPAVHLLVRRIIFLQEQACDEAVTIRSGVSRRDYCRCLIRVAESAITGVGTPLVRSCMAVNNQTELMLRVNSVLNKPHAKRHGFITAAMALSVVAICAATTFANPSMVHDRRIEELQAKRMAEIAQRDSTFPIVINDRVITQLNRLLATHDGLALSRAGVRNMEMYKSLISEELQRNALPSELLAVPFVESWYKNLPHIGEPWHGTGLWMFIEPTAIKYGLQVTPTNDERLDVNASTAAAIQLLTDLRHKFDTWDLALLAYHAGESEVKLEIQKPGQRDGWSITKNSEKQDDDYLARMMATIIILKNESMLEK